MVSLKSMFATLLQVTLHAALSLRYRITLRGKENLTREAFPKPGGILFLANHPAEVDPLILLTYFWSPFRVRPVAIDYLFRTPIIGHLLRFINALSLPNFEGASNSYKRKQMQQTYQQICESLDRGENVLIYPAGALKREAREVIGGASSVHSILQMRPETNVALIRTTGLWGSSSSKAITGATPDMWPAFFQSCKVLLWNGLFFSPRRTVEIDCMPAPGSFPYQTDRVTLNRYLENWFNQGGPEPLALVSFSRIRESYPQIQKKTLPDKTSLSAVSPALQKSVIEEIRKLKDSPSTEITLDTHLAQDLGFDSLDSAQLAVTLKDKFGIDTLQAGDLTTVGEIIAYAAKIKTAETREEKMLPSSSTWQGEKHRPSNLYPEGRTIPEVFLRTCERMGTHLACVDLVSKEITYRDMKRAMLLFAEIIRHLPGERIGIMLPASVAVNVLILATMLVGKVPVMFNWTLGERNLRSVVDQSGVQVVLSSWQFIDRLDNIELDGVDDKLLFIENLKKESSLFDKLRVWWRSTRSTDSILRTFGINKYTGEERAVILFTSGTESFPKGVPLSHSNMILNQKAAYARAQLFSWDTLLGCLPSFHSFGFSVTGLLPLLTGIRVAYSPNPTDGKRVSEALARWGVTLICLAPTFLKTLLRAASPQQMRTLRLILTGAERTSADLYQKLERLNPETVLLEGYGITECAPILTLQAPDERGGGVGPPLSNVTLQIVHPETMESLPVGKEGLILARGPNIFKGYLDPRIPSPFVTYNGQEWYQTGDIGYLTETEKLFLSGRLKRFVKIGGEMVSLTAVESTLQELGVKKGWKIAEEEGPSLAVCALEQEGKKSEIYLFTTFPVTTEEANQLLREGGMSNIIKIRAAFEIPAIPMLGTGKVDYRALSTQLHTSDPSLRNEHG